MPVGKMGPQDVETVEPTADVREAVERLESENVGSLVVAENGSPVGMVTDRDVAMAVAETDDVGSESVESIMTEDPVTIAEDAEALEISRTVDEHNVRRIPVVDEDGDLTGIVTVDDLVATVGEQLDNVADTIESQSPDYSP